MNRQIKWGQREDREKWEREEKKIEPTQIYLERRLGGHSRTKVNANQNKMEKHVSAYEKQVERRRELENKRLLRRISEIHRRKSSLSQHEQEQQKRLHTLNMVSKKWQREKQDKNLQQQNDIIVQRIVRMRSYNGPLAIQELSKSQHRRKDSNRSLMLPKIEEYQVDI